MLNCRHGCGIVKGENCFFALVEDLKGNETILFSVGNALNDDCNFYLDRDGGRCCLCTQEGGRKQTSLRHRRSLEHCVVEGSYSVDASILAIRVSVTVTLTLTYTVLSEASQFSSDNCRVCGLMLDYRQG